ncbi:MAG TPA: ABC transporter ATP-binding protein [Syntrophomonadaceae bacterium]|nr:ABC transporter ATP-binding protein [Syntrophomonadaceae bacterium]
MLDLAININDISKSFDGLTALDHITMQVPYGCVCGLVGPNGAGKSTLIKICMDILRPDHGEVELLGENPRWKNRVRERVGYVSDIPGMYPNFKCEEMFQLGSKLYPHWDSERCRDLSSAFEIPATRSVHALSRGMKVRMALVMALAIRPRLLLLDEPTAGLDPLFRREFLQVVMDEVAGNGTTVFYSTHNLADLERAADYVGCLNNGRLLFHHPLDEMKGSLHRVQMMVDDEQVLMIQNRLPDILDAQRNGRLYSITIEGNWPEIEAVLNNLGSFYPEKVNLSLEEAFVSLMRKDGYNFKLPLHSERNDECFKEVAP